MNHNNIKHDKVKQAVAAAAPNSSWNTLL